MKILLAVGLAFAGIVSFANHAAEAQEQNERTAVEQKASGLELSLVLAET
jgi:hypothetical protein